MSHGKPRVDDKRELSGIIFINGNGLRWRHAPETYGPLKTLYSLWKRWREKGIFARIIAGLAAEHGEEKTVMIDLTFLKVHRIATSMAATKGGLAARHDRCPKVLLSVIALAATVFYWF